MRRSPVRRQSARRRRRDATYPAARKQVFSRAEGMCEAQAIWACERSGHQVHHIAGRGGRDPHNPEGLLLVCAPCHAYIHANPQLSYERGWLRRRNAGPVGGYVSSSKPAGQLGPPPSGPAPGATT